METGIAGGRQAGREKEKEGGREAGIERERERQPRGMGAAGGEGLSVWPLYGLRE